MRPDALLEALRRSGIDVAFLYGPFEDGLLAHATVAEEALVVALPDGHPLARRARVDVRALRDEPFILPARHGMPGLHARVLAFCERAGFVPRAVQKDVWLMQTVIGLVAARVGVAVVPESVEDLRRTGVVYRAARGAALRVELAVAWRRDDRSPLLARFLACAREDTGEPAQQGPRVLPGSVPTLTP
jgi:DNA-binding transcriptional LysR family regulator